MNNEYPFTRHDPGELPTPPENLTIAAASWWWKIAAWAKVRDVYVHVTLEQLGNISQLLARWERETDEKSREVALMNISIQLAECGFCSVDLEHLDIPEHEIFKKHRQNVKQKLERYTLQPEHKLDMSRWRSATDN